MKTFLMIVLITLFSLSSFAQNTWQGGTPGDPTNWSNPRNWTLNKVPDWTRHVVIPDVSSKSGYIPEIDSEIGEIPSLEICNGAKLHITNTGFLKINGESTSNHGIMLFGEIENKGEIQIANTDLRPLYIATNQIAAFKNDLGNVRMLDDRASFATTASGF